MTHKSTITRRFLRNTVAVLLVASAGALWLFRFQLKPANSSNESGMNASISSQTQPEQTATVVSLNGEIRLPSSSMEILSLLQSPDQLRLSHAAIQEALEYLKRPKAAETEEDPAAEYFNNVIAILLAQPQEVDALPQTLCTAVNDKNLPLLLRNYAMQHCFHIWNREKNPSTKRAIEAHLKSHFEDSQSPLQGVALLTASRIYEQGMAVKNPNGEKLVSIGGTTRNAQVASKPTLFSKEEFVGAALKITLEPAAAANARTCAFNVLQQLEVSQSVYGARELLKDAKAPDEVRCAAIAAIGAFGDLAIDQEFLDTVPVRPESVRAAADYAIGQLKRSQFTR